MPNTARTAARRESAANPSAAPNGLRPLPRRRALLNGRAALGGLLVAVATLVLFSAAQPGGGELERYVVARRALSLGTRISAADLTTSAMHLPPGPLRTRLFGRPDRLVGAVVVASVARGELVQASAVLAANGVAEQRQISVPIESARALGDRLQPGEVVDVVATFGTGALMSPELVLINGVRIAAAGLAAYLALVAIVGIALRVVGANVLASTLDTFTPRVVRHIVAAAVGITLLISAEPTSAADAPIVMHRLPDGTPSSSTSTTTTAQVTTTTPTRPPAIASPATAPNLLSTWTIRPGQHFWAVAELVLRAAWGRPPTAAEIIPYWNILIDANRDRLADRNNPDLLFPGQVLVLPTPPGP